MESSNGTKRLYNFHLVNDKFFSQYLDNDELKAIRKKWIIGISRKAGELIIGNYILQAKDLILIGLDITE
jgi:hypothetical protein